MKKMISILIFLLSMLFAGPAFAHIVEKGETMTSIAHDHQLSLPELAEANPEVTDLNLILVGQKLAIPKSGQLSSTKNGQAGDSHKQEPSVLPAVSTADQHEAPAEKHDFTAAELDLLARIVRAEAETESFEGKVAVACVVLNRIDSPKFPDSIEAVIYAHNQFQPVANGQINKKADQESVMAAEAALTTHRKLAGDAVFFYNPAIAANRWLDSRETVTAIGNHVFKK